ncbi:MAG: arylesterase [Alcanivoracaceae bacterium]|nr:arylesterase [Alcanivoracaceae bacterium]
MMRFIFILSFVLSCISCNQSASSNSQLNIDAPIQNFVILALGDSLTEGLGVAEHDNYPSVLQDSLPQNIKVVNAGLSAETSTGLKNRLSWVLKQNPDLTILNIGANDAMRGLSLELTKNNIDEIINTIKQADSDVILMGMQIYENLGKEYVNEFTNIYPQLAKKHNIPLVPFFLEHVAGNQELNQNDMLHPNAKGYKIIVEQNILPVVKNYLKTQMVWD